MTEAYLHFIWKLKRIPFHLLKTTNGKQIQIVNNGIYNSNESGPDFFNARIIYEGIEWAGQLEMHIKSSDWYKHNHQHDPAFDNVIVHVVYEHDKEVFINGKSLLTIELKPYIDEKHYQQWEQFAYSMKAIPCENSLKDLDEIYLKSMMHRAVADRLTRKVNQLLYHAGDLTEDELLYFLIARAFGSKVNTMPFEFITHQLPLSLLKRMNKSLQRSLVIQSSGLFEQPETNLLAIPTSKPLPSSVWKRKGLRPTSYPEKRVVQFAEFISRCDFELIVAYLHPKEAYEYVVLLFQQMKNELEQLLTTTFMDLLFINAFLPYFWLKAQRTENDELMEQVLRFLEVLKPEENYILKKWKEIGVKPSNAYESQALIEIYNEYCHHKKCLECQVGAKILRG